MDKTLITRKLLLNHQRFADFVSNLDEAEFLFSQENKWTAGQQLDHIVRGVAPVRLALSLPSLAPRILFGSAKRNSVSYEDLVKNYQTKLSEGGQATGRFVPAEIRFDQRKTLIDKLLSLTENLCKKVECFREEQLDEYYLPHPILGKLTVREMLYFTIYHVEHHHKNTIKNLGQR